MSRFADKFRVESVRLPNWDYSTPGTYFITICTYNHINLLGKCINGRIELKSAGKICLSCLKDIPKHFLNIKILESIIMPNHVHLLLELIETKFNPVETHHGASLLKRYQNYHFHRLAIKSNQTISNSINQFKSSVKRLCNQEKLYFSWQPRFYDEIITDQVRLQTIKHYIGNNPKNWLKDKLFSLR